MRPTAPATATRPHHAHRLALPLIALGSAAILLVQNHIALTVVAAAMAMGGWLLTRAARSLRRAGLHIDTILNEELGPPTRP